MVKICNLSYKHPRRLKFDTSAYFNQSKKIARLRQAAIAINLLHAKYFIICIAFYKLHFIHCISFCGLQSKHFSLCNASYVLIVMLSVLYNYVFNSFIHQSIHNVVFMVPDLSLIIIQGICSRCITSLCIFSADPDFFSLPFAYCFCILFCAI